MWNDLWKGHGGLNDVQGGNSPVPRGRPARRHIPAADTSAPTQVLRSHRNDHPDAPHRTDTRSDDACSLSHKSPGTGRKTVIQLLGPSFNGCVNGAVFKDTNKSIFRGVGFNDLTVCVCVSISFSCSHFIVWKMKSVSGWKYLLEKLNPTGGSVLLSCMFLVRGRKSEKYQAYSLQKDWGSNQWCSCCGVRAVTVSYTLWPIMNYSFKKEGIKNEKCVQPYPGHFNLCIILFVFTNVDVWRSFISAVSHGNHLFSVVKGRFICDLLNGET